MGGTAYFVSNSTGVEGERSTSLALQPALGYFVVPDLAVGATVGLTYSSFAGNSYVVWAAAPSLTYYLGSPENSVRPLFGARFGLVGGNDMDLSTNLGLTAGVILMISPSVGLTAESFYNNSLGQPSDWNAFGIRLGVSTFVW